MTFAVLSPALASASDASIMPLAEVRVGMIGKGVTVFTGAELEEFEVEILGVLENTAPRRNTILAMLAGGPLAKSGVIAGMSGSPVYVDGRLIGAVSSGFLFSKEPIAGITPIEEMLSIPTKDWSTIDGALASADARRASVNAPSGSAFPAALQRRLGAIERGEASSSMAALAARNRPSTDSARGGLPIVLSGFGGAAFERASALFSSFGLVPMQGGGVARSALVKSSLEPGDPIAVELIRGDLNIAAYGTVTARDGKDVLAFGHPLFNVGSVRFPIAAAEVVAVLPSVYSSFKISTLGSTLGALSQDRLTGVLGRLGDEAPMIPVRLGIQRGQNPIESFSFEVATHRLLSSVLIEMSLLNGMLATEKLIGESTVALRGHIEVDGQKHVVLDHFFSGDQSPSSMAGLVAAIVQILLDNPFSPADVKGMTLVVDYLEDNRYALLDRVWTRSSYVRAGDVVVLKAYLQRLRGEEEEVTLRVRVPDGTPPGPIELVVGDASALAQFEMRSERYVPRSLPQLIELINSLRKSSSVYALLTRPEAGVAVSGFKHTRLPLSAYTLLLSGSEQETLLPIRRSNLAEVEVSSMSQITGFKLVKLEVVGDVR